MTSIRSQLSLKTLIPAGQFVRILFWSGVFALSTAGYGALAGPVLRALFGGSSLEWPNLIANWLPPPPSIETLRTWLPWCIVAISFIKGASAYRQQVLTARLGQKISRSLRERLHHRFLEWPPEICDSFGVGELTSRLSGDVDQVELLCTEGCFAILRDAFQIVALLTLCIVIDPKLTLLAFCLYPLAFWPIAKFLNQLKKLAKQSQQNRASMNTLLHDHISRLSLFQLSGEEQHAEANFSEANQKIEKAVVRAAWLKGIASPLTECLGALTLALTLIYVSHEITQVHLSAEHVTSFFVALMMLYQPVKGIVRTVGQIVPAYAAFERLSELDANSKQLPKGGALLPPNSPPRIEFVDLSVMRGERTVISHFNAALEAGKVTALCGLNGSGKTTLAWTLGGLLSPVDGKILINSESLQKYDLEKWRQKLAYAGQGSLLGRGTLRENLLFGTNCEDSKLIEIIKKVGFPISNFQNGLNTELGDWGSGLSGGESQRIALCRALLRDAPFIILDEPEAHLDREHAQMLMAVLRNCRATVLLITHDESLKTLSDACVTLEKHL